MHPRERGGKTNCHLVRALLNKAPNALRTPCDTPKWIVSSLTMTGKLDNPVLSHRPSWTLSTDATSFIDVGKHSVCITNTHHSADPALLPPPHQRGNRGSPLPTAEETGFILGSAEISVQTRLDVCFFKWHLHWYLRYIFFFDMSPARGYIFLTFVRQNHDVKAWCIWV